MKCLEQGLSGTTAEDDCDDGDQGGGGQEHLERGGGQGQGQGQGQGRWWSRAPAGQQTWT